MALTKSLSFSLERKRLLISNNSCDLQHFCEDFECFTPMKKLCSPEIGIQRDFSCVYSNSLLQALPQELLIKVICGVDHEDLKNFSSSPKQFVMQLTNYPHFLSVYINCLVIQIHKISR